MKNSDRAIEDIKIDLINAKDILYELENNPDAETEQHIWNVPEKGTEKEKQERVADNQRLYIKQKLVEIKGRISELNVELLRKEKHDKQAYTNTKNLIKFENNTLLLTLNDGTQDAITFSTRSKNKYMLTVFSTLYQHWKRKGNEPLAKGVLKQELMGVNMGRAVSDKFLKDTISNIRKSKIASSKLSNVVKITYDANSQGYSLDINLHNEIRRKYAD